MANEISWGNLETDAGLAHYLANELHFTLANAVDLRAALVRYAFTGGMGSETIKVTKVAHNQAFAAASTELSGGASNASIGSGNAQLTVSRRLLKWLTTDLWRLVAPNGSINIDLLVRLINERAGVTVSGLLCDLFPSLSNNVGSTTNPMSLDYHFDAQFQLNLSRAGGPFFEVLRPKAFNQLQSSLRAESGVLGWQPATAEMIAAKGPGFKGTIGSVEVWDTDDVDADGGNAYYQSSMFAYGCFAFTEAPAAAMTDTMIPGTFRIDGGAVLTEFDRTPADGTTALYGNYYPAVSELEDARGVEIRTAV